MAQFAFPVVATAIRHIQFVADRQGDKLATIQDIEKLATTAVTAICRRFTTQENGGKPRPSAANTGSTD